uniref:Vesicle transport protein USE1 n=1 Tax=Panagrellus redivivus TaxID=6233 RepID=A0A7E4V782_PANRE
MSPLTDELNFQRLLHRCKKLSRDALADNKYKLEAFLRVLEDLYMKLQDDKTIVNDVLMQYGREFHNLKILIDVEKKKTAEEKFEAMQALPKIFPGEGQELRQRTSAVGTSNSISGDGELEDKVSNAVIKAANEAVYRADIRRQLMAGSKPDFDIKTATNEVDFLNNQETTQAELSEDLLKLTLALKQNVTVAGSVVKEDNAFIPKKGQQNQSN